MHGHLEIEMGMAADFESLECNSSSPETVAWNARAVMTGYRALTEPVTGYEGLVKDFGNGQFVAHHFFMNIGRQQARDALAGILHAWRDVLKDFIPPSNCRRGPPSAVGIVEEGNADLLEETIPTILRVCPVHPETLLPRSCWINPGTGWR